MTAPAPALPVTAEELQKIESAFFQSDTDRFTTTQRLFFEALLSNPDCDPVVAARRVGVKPSRAKRWLQRDDVKEVMNHLVQSRMKRLGIDKDLLLVKIVDLLEMATGEKPIKRVAFHAKHGEFVQEELHETDLAAAARFTDQLGKHFQLFQPEGMSGMQVVMNMNFGGGLQNAQPQPFEREVGPGSGAAVTNQDSAPVPSTDPLFD